MKAILKNPKRQKLSFGQFQRPEIHKNSNLDISLVKFSQSHLKMSSTVSRKEFEALKEELKKVQNDVSDTKDDVNEVNSKLDEVKKELIDQKRAQIDLARQSHKTCIVLSGNDVVVWRNAKKAFVHLANKVFGVKVGYFDLQVRFGAILYGFVNHVS